MVNNMYQKMRYNPETNEMIHDFQYISESDLVFNMVNHGHTVFYEFLRDIRKNPYIWYDIYRYNNDCCVVLWAD